jgi:hypothetical protein
MPFLHCTHPLQPQEFSMMHFRHVLISATAFVALIGAATTIHAQGSGETAGLDTLSGFRSTLSRDEVRAELLQAQRAGQIVNGDTAFERVLFAQLQRPSPVTRAQVRAELFEARRLGLLERGYEVEPPQATPAQVERIRQAGQRAVGNTLTLATQ